MIIDITRVIAGKRYNTNTATEICFYDNGLNGSDFHFERSGLYVTKSGTFFIAGEGGACSRWSSRDGNNYCNGKGVIVVSEGEALAFAEKHAESDVISQFFQIEDA